jgi:hypothetical protein
MYGLFSSPILLHGELVRGYDGLACCQGGHKECLDPPSCHGTHLENVQFYKQKGRDTVNCTRTTLLICKY